MNKEIIYKELEFKAVKSSGPGGQHVNKTASKVEVYFHIKNSNGLSEEEKEQLLIKLSSKISAEGYFKITSSETRSQHQNKELVVLRLFEILKENSKKNKARKKTKPSKASIEERLKKKKNTSLKKVNRKPPKIE